MVWVIATAGVLLSAIYITATIRIWQRRSKWWSLLALTNAFVYTYPTATYIWEATHDLLPPPEDPPWGLLLFILPALLVLRLIQWGIQDEADAVAAVEHLGEE